MLNKKGESGHACLDSYFKGKSFSLSLLSMMMLAVGLSYISFIMVRCVPSIPVCWGNKFLDYFYIGTITPCISVSICFIYLGAVILGA